MFEGGRVSGEPHSSVCCRAVHRSPRSVGGSSGLGTTLTSENRNKSIIGELSLLEAKTETNRNGFYGPVVLQCSRTRRGLGRVSGVLEL